MATLSLKALDAKLSPQASSGKVVLDASLFENNDNMTTLLNQYFSATKSSIEIDSVTGYKYTPDDSIVFAGVGKGGPFDGMKITQVGISVDVSTPATPVPQLFIDAIPVSDYTLNKSFPSIKSPAISLLTYDNETQEPIFFWASYTSDEDNTIEGFYFQGKAKLITPLDFITTFIPSLPTPVLSGNITMVGSESKTGDISQYLPSGTLAIDVEEKPVKLGPIVLTETEFLLFVDPVFNEYDKRWQTHSSLGLKSKISFMDYWVIFEVDIHDPKTDILFTASMDVNIFGTLEKLAAFVGEKALSIPRFPVKSPNSISLQDVKVGYNPSAGKVKMVTVDMGTDEGETWPLWGHVNLNNIVVQFRVIPGVEVDGFFSGHVNDWLSLSASFATTGSYTFYGGLLKPVSIKDVYTFFAGDTITALPDLEISTLYVKVVHPPSPGKTSFEGAITIDGIAPDFGWKIIDDPVHIVLKGLQFKIQHNVENAEVAGVEGANNSMLAGGMLEVGDYLFSVQAAYKSGTEPTDGWTFNGKMELEGDGHDVTTFGSAVDKFFGIDPDKSSPIPNVLKDWYIPSITAQFNTNSKDFEFTCELKNTDVPDLDMTFTFKVTHGDTYTREFDGVATYTNDSISMEFDLKYITEKTTKAPIVTTTTVLGKYQADKPPKLSDFLMALSKSLKVDVALPAALDLDAEVDGFAVKVVKEGTEPSAKEMAGDFTFMIKGSDWELYFAYTNDTKFGKVAAKVGEKKAYVFGVAISGVLDLSKLPLVGDIPGVNKLKIDKLGFYYTNAEFSADNKKLTFEVPELESKNKLSPSGTDAELNQKGFNLLAVLGNKTSDDAKKPTESMGSMPLPVHTGDAGSSPDFAKDASLPKDPVKWLNINKTFGPVTFEKIGFTFGKPEDSKTQLGEIGLYLNGSFKLASFGMALDHLGVSFMIPKPTPGGASFNPIKDTKFHLGGLFVDYQAPSFQIGGGFVTLPGGSVNFIGEFIVQAGEFGLQAYGGFSNELPEPSLFIFAHVEFPIGGPPFFFINGISGGFGINRDFKLPSYDDLTNYPLMPGNQTIPTGSDMTGSASDKLEKMMKALTALSTYIPVEQGQYWVAVGLDVSSFEMINVSAVLSVAFGVRFQIGLVGNANMTFPLEKGDEGGMPPIAYISIDFEVVISPDTGLFAAFGKLTPDSYILASFVHISGGFAMLFWFSGEHKGDFLVSIGGYNAHFNKPDYYPTIPRLEIKFGIDSLNVRGDAYFALTPAMFMAGFGIHATWSLGPLEAYFDAGMDFIINWKPFHYFADGYIHIGISLVIKIWFVHIRITIHVGVDLEVWGPKFGGKATVDLDIVSFTIHFGASQTSKDVKWADVQQMLPDISPPAAKPEAARFAPMAAPMAALETEAAGGSAPVYQTNITVYKSIGLVKKFTDDDRVDDLDWLISPNYFELMTKTNVPISDAIIATEEYDSSTPPKPVKATTIDLKTALAGGLKYVDPNPNKIKDSVKTEIEAHKEYPFFGYSPPTEGNSWDKTDHGIVPMNVPKIKSTHYVTVKDIVGGEMINDLIYLLETENVTKSIWGTDGHGQAGSALGNQKQTVPNSLTGFRIVPAIFFPKRTAPIPYYYLVFDVNNLFLFEKGKELTAPAVKTTPYSDPDEIFQNMNDGKLFGSTQSGPFTGTASRRETVVEDLKDYGFTELVLENDESFNTENYLDNPVLCYMSDTDETTF